MGGPSSEAAEIYRQAVASGWASYIRVESLLLATDPRPLGFGALTVRELLAAFEIPLQWTYHRPPRGNAGVIGIEQVMAVDLAHLLVLLEATGFAIDPAPLCEALRPQLRASKYLTAAGMSVWWHQKERHRCDPKTIATGVRKTWGRWSEEVTTSTGYRASLFRGDDGEPTALQVTAPKWRPGRRLAA
jgi:hypothetical protein